MAHIRVVVVEVVKMTEFCTYSKDGAKSVFLRIRCGMKTPRCLAWATPGMELGNKNLSVLERLHSANLLAIWGEISSRILDAEVRYELENESGNCQLALTDTRLAETTNEKKEEGQVNMDEDRSAM